MITLHACHVSDLQAGDIARGVNHSRIISGPPVRVTRVRDLGDGYKRVTYLIIGLWTHGTRTLADDRGVTVERASAS